MNCNVFLIIIQVYSVYCQLNVSMQTQNITEYTSGDVLDDIQITTEVASGETFEVRDSNYSDTANQPYQNCSMKMFTHSQFFQQEYDYIINYLEENEPGENWDTVFRATSK